ncbi:membrane protein [Pseudonocardia sp. EC080610-09]|uniref:protein kinase family protein n=1 Tax=unclassified Pseudonocardia TaxID=2619320 RepID=UPI000706E23F|nr:MULTISPECIES: protein kinase family protein [unclassified Pseudonocardia]ALL74918.1 membrane protein [Pseudonocardia sp. EC080610-09]ALL81940.1 membrane protein [Pseudonocardia sp. EC080619-01]
MGPLNGQTDQGVARTGARTDTDLPTVEGHPSLDPAETPAATETTGTTAASSPSPRPSPQPSPHPRARPADDQPTARVPAQARPTERIPAAKDALGTAAGSNLTDRYVLRQRIGTDAAAGAEFWRAEDTVLRRPVGVTLLRRLPADDRSDDPEGTARAGEMIVRALRSGCFEHPGSARLLDVLAPGTHGLPADVLGASVAEWVPGRSLAETVAEGPVRAQRAAKAVEALASAATEAHQQGLVLGCDHPQRVRITPDGRAMLAFLLPRPSVSAADDVRGLGGLLYCLLTRRWPLSVADSARAGLVAADRTPAGRLRSPAQLRPGVPLELDTLCMGALGQAGDGLGRVHTAAAMHRMLTDVVAEDADQAFFPPVHDGAPADPDDVWQDSDRLPDTRNDPQRRRNLRIGLTVLAVGVLIVLGYLSVQVGALFGGSGAPPVVIPPAATAPAAPQGTAPQGAAPAAAVVPVGDVSVQVFDPTGDGDNAGTVDRVLDGDPATTWTTSRYFQPFPALKPGIGVMASFDAPQPVSRLTIDSASPGTVVEVRSAPSAEASLDETTPITTVTLRDGETVVPLDAARPTGHVLLWITTLSSGNQSAIGEIAFARAAG